MRSNSLIISVVFSLVTFTAVASGAPDSSGPEIHPTTNAQLRQLLLGRWYASRHWDVQTVAYREFRADGQLMDDWSFNCNDDSIPGQWHVISPNSIAYRDPNKGDKDPPEVLKVQFISKNRLRLIGGSTSFSYDRDSSDYYTQIKGRWRSNTGQPGTYTEYDFLDNPNESAAVLYSGGRIQVSVPILVKIAPGRLVVTEKTVPGSVEYVVGFDSRSGFLRLIRQPEQKLELFRCVTDADNSCTQYVAAGSIRSDGLPLADPTPLKGANKDILAAPVMSSSLVMSTGLPARYTIAITEGGSVYSGQLMGEEHGRQLTSAELKDYLIVGVNRPGDLMTLICRSGYQSTAASASHGISVGHDPDGIQAEIIPGKRGTITVTCTKK